MCRLKRLVGLAELLRKARRDLSRKWKCEIRINGGR